MKIKGEFEVSLEPIDSYSSGSDGIQLGRMSINKTFHGPLQGNSIGEMLSARTPVEGSAGYVAIEQVEGSLEDKAGTFVLQHFGILNKGTNRLVLEVVPDSGTGELQGLSGQMSIDIVDGKHYYELDYVL